MNTYCIGRLRTGVLVASLVASLAHEGKDRETDRASYLAHEEGSPTTQQALCCLTTGMGKGQQAEW